MTDRGGGELPGREERRGNAQITDGDEPADHEKAEDHDPQERSMMRAVTEEDLLRLS